MKRCSECGREVENLTRGLCPSRCYRKAMKAGLSDAPPRLLRTTEECDRLTEEILRILSENPASTQKSVATELGLAQSTISKMLRKRGYRLYPNRRKNNYDTLAERYWTLRASGYHELTMAQMAEKLGTYERAIYRALKMHRYDFVEDNYDYA